MVGGTFNTVIGFIFLAIVIVSPDGLMGVWERLWSIRVVAVAPPGSTLDVPEPVAEATS